MRVRKDAQGLQLSALQELLNGLDQIRRQSAGWKEANFQTLTLAPHSHRQLCSATLSPRFLPGPGCQVGRKGKTELQQPRFGVPHTGHHVFDHLAAHPSLPAHSRTRLGVPGSTPVAAVGYPQMKPCVFDRSIL